MFKGLYTALHSSGSVRKAKIRQKAAELEERIQEQIRMDLATDGQFAEWEMASAKRDWSDCIRCPLHVKRDQVVFGEGHANAPLLVVGEGPGANEDETGRPFSPRGKSGRLLRMASKKIGLSLKQQAFVTNMVLCRPPGNRRPRDSEMLECRNRLSDQARIVRPRVILLLGGAAATWCGLKKVGDNRGLVPKEDWPDLHGSITVGRDRLRAVILTWHPSYIVRQGGESKRRVFHEFVADLRKVKLILDKCEEVYGERGR